MKRPKAVVLAWMTLALAPPIGALSVRGPSKELAAHDLRAGETYRLSTLAKNPAVTNTGGKDVSVRMRIARARVQELDDGYEPLPSPAWIRLKKTIVRLRPEESVPIAALIRVPRDEKFKGGQYEALWIGEIMDRNGAGLILSSRILISVADDADENFSRPARRKSGAPPRYAAVPALTKAENVPLGEKIALESLGVRLKIANYGNVPARFRLRLIRRAAKDAKAPPGFIPAPDPHFLRIGRPDILVPAESIASENLSLEIPDEARYRGKRWIFTIEILPYGFDPSFARYWKLEVWTKPDNSREDSR
ncbi:MAG: hypothetical protein ACYCPQ_10075 [Elusimicrobiota bacterium]